MPGAGDAAVVGAPEAVGRAGSITTVQLVLITVITTVIVSITEPVWLHTDGGVLALEVIRWAGYLRALVYGFI